MAKARRRIRTPEQETARVAKAIGLPPEQAKFGLTVVDVANYSEADQRHSIRSEQTKTVRKLTRIERLVRAGTIELEDAPACEAYANWHALGYDTVGCTANYMGAGGGGFGPSELWARYRAQRDARECYTFARAGIPTALIPLFESVVLHGKALVSWRGSDGLGKSARTSRLSNSFRLAVRHLNERVGHMLVDA